MSDDHDETTPLPLNAGDRCDDRSPHAIEQQILAISRRSTVDTVAAALDASDWLLARAKGISEVAKRLAIEWIEHNGPFGIGEQQYSVGYATTTKCINPRGCGHELLRVLGGDFDEYLQTLAAQPYKYGAVAKLLDKPVYRSFFTVTSTARLINGVPEPTLKRTNLAFAGSRGGK